MAFSDQPHDQSRDSYMACILAVLVGVPLFVFFNIATGGLLGLLLLSAAGIGVLGLVNYWLWGRAFTAETAGEREEEALRQQLEVDGSSWDDSF